MRILDADFNATLNGVFGDMVEFAPWKLKTPPQRGFIAHQTLAVQDISTRRRAIKPTSPSPASIMAQVSGSGTGCNA